MATPSEQFKEEFLRIISKVELFIRQQSPSKSLLETKTICYCYLLTIGQIIHADLAALSTGDLVVHQIVMRSLTEYLLDLMLVAKRNRNDFNRQFAGFHRLSIYFKRELIDEYKGQIAATREQYFKEVIEAYPEMFDTEPGAGPNLISPDWNKIEKQLKQRIRKGWTGLSFKQKLFCVLLEHATTAHKEDSALKLWQRAEATEKRVRGQGWDKLSFNEKADAIIRNLQREAGLEVVGLSSVDPNLVWLLKAYGLGSDFTHPTPRSVVPHLDLQRETFQLEYDFDEGVLDMAQQGLFMLYTSAAYSASPVFVQQDRKTLRQQYDRWTVQSPAIKSWYLEALKRACATSPRH